MCLRFIHIHVVAYICASFFFYRWLIFHCRNRLPFSIYSSADGYLSCFHILAVMNIALLWTFMHECLCEQMFSVFLGVYLGVGLLGHMVMLTFWGAVRLSKEAAPLPVPNTEVWHVCFDYIHPGGRGTLGPGLDCLSLMDDWGIEHCFMCPWPWCIFFYVLCPFLNWIICLLVVKL